MRPFRHRVHIEIVMLERGLPFLRRPFVLIEDRLAPGRPAKLYSDPIDVIRCDQASTISRALEEVESATRRGLHAAGFLSYEAGCAFEPKLYTLLSRLCPREQKERRLPLAWFGLFEAPQSLEPRALDAAFAALGPPPPLTAIVPGHSRKTHIERCDRILDLLRAGDVYQVNLTFPISFRWSGDPLSLYAALRAAQPVAHGAVVALEEITIISVSPELFLRTESRTIEARPMKGTVPRGGEIESDSAARQNLLHDPKQRAENLMIVDLLRNDVSRVAEVGSVKVPELFRIESYPTFHAMTSTVIGRLREDIGPADVIRATFPCGSVTGAPKHRAMEIIAGLEGSARGAYTGSIGAIEPGGKMDFNVAIRTAVLHLDGEGCWGSGGGIVADSNGENEYEEALLKARVLTDLATDYRLIEVFRFDPGNGFVRLELHLARLAASAERLGFNLDVSLLRANLDALAAPFDAAAGSLRVRVELCRDGSAQLAAPPLAPDPDRDAQVMLWPDPVDAGDPFLAHKTTRRTRFDVAGAEASRREIDDFLFVNRDGFLTETTRANIFVERNGKLLTPALCHGFLPGVLRRSLIEGGRAVEADLRPADLVSSDAWFVGNSLRGLRKATLLQGREFDSGA
jgi:para-aminobenzoate synthetase/4-amino-4-deoxychorismate lyase